MIWYELNRMNDVLQIKNFINNAINSYTQYYYMIKSTNETLKPYDVVVSKHRRFGICGPRKKKTHYPELQSIPPNPRLSINEDN